MRSRTRIRVGGLIALALCFASCATPPTPGPKKVPFHVALVPVDVGVLQIKQPIEEGEETGISLAFAEQPVTKALLDAMTERFAKATLLTAAPEGASKEENYEAWVEEARRQGADLILDASLRYDERIHTALNDLFWRNLPLFAIGGPFNWLVNDRSYYVHVQLDAELYSVDGVGKVAPPDQITRVSQLKSQAQEARLDFIDRGNHIGAYLLAVFLPSGFVSSESDAVLPELQAVIAKALGDGLTGSVQASAAQLTQWDRVDFYPTGVRVTEDRRFLEGELVLRLVGNVSRLRFLRYRTDSGPFQDHDLGEGERVPASGRQPGMRRYPFRIPIDGVGVRFIQLKVGQEDIDATSRTFTYVVPGSSPRPRR